MDKALIDERTPQPDHISTAQLWREIAALKELFQNEIQRIDKSIEVAHNDLVRVPTDVQKAVGNLKELHEEKFRTVVERFETVKVEFEGVGKQFLERDVRTQQAAEASTTAVNAALQAQKESASKQAEAFQEATNKSEQQFTKQIDQQGELLRTEVRGMVAQFNELKDRFNRGEGVGVGADKSKTDNRGQISMIVGIILALFAVIAFFIDRVIK